MHFVMGLPTEKLCARPSREHSSTSRLWRAGSTPVMSTVGAVREPQADIKARSEKARMKRMIAPSQGCMFTVKVGASLSCYTIHTTKPLQWVSQVEG